MSRDYEPMFEKRCNACMNWDGTRNIIADKRQILVDEREYANCRFWHTNKQGDDTCVQYSPIQ
jgi:hypothetical protein